MSPDDALSPSTSIPPPRAVVDYLLSRRHLAAAFELYQDLLSTRGDTENDGCRDNGHGPRGDAVLERQMGRAGGAFPPAGAANEAEARDALEAYFADPRLFPLADLQRYVDGVDIPMLQATCKEQESRIRVAEYDCRVAVEDLTRMREEQTERPPRGEDGSAGEGSRVGGSIGRDGSVPKETFDRVDPGGAGGTSEEEREGEGVSSIPAPDGFLNRSDATASIAAVSPADGPLPPIGNGERRVLNVLVHEYLLARGYRATALTLNDEVSPAGQDMDDWSVVGGKPAGGEALRLMLRRAKTLEVLDPNKLSALTAENSALRGRCEAAEAAMASAEARRAAAAESEEALVETVSSLRLQRDEAAVEAARWRARAEEAMAMLGGRGNGGERKTGTEAGDDGDGPSEGRSGETRNVPAGDAGGGGSVPEGESLGVCVGSSSSEIARRGWTAGGGALEAAAEEEATVAVLVDALPRVSLHVLIQHRVELLPLFQRAIARCRVPSLRSSTTALLFSLIKRPGADQRRMLADACANIARVVGEARTAEELIPQCFEQVSHKHEERRLLVAETCGKLARHVGEGLRSSLLLTMLQQQAETDRNAAVREGVARNLVALVDADPDPAKAHTVEALLLRLAMDPADEVSELAVDRLTPAVSAWLLRANAGERLHTSLLPAVMARATAVLSGAALSEGSFRPMAEDDRWRVGVLLRIVERLVSAVRAVAARSAPPSLVAALDRKRRSADSGVSGAGDALEGDASPDRPSECLAASEMDAALATFADSPRGTHVWPAADWLLGEGAALVARLARATPPAEEGVRRAVVAAMRAHCLAAGEDATASCVAPVVAAAAGARRYVNDAAAPSPEASPSPSASGLGSDPEVEFLPAARSLDPSLLAPPPPASRSVARAAALPLFLVGVLSHAGRRPLLDALRGVVNGAVTEAASQPGGASCLDADVASAVAYAAGFDATRGPVVALLGELAGAASPTTRSAAALLLGAAASELEETEVTSRVLPVLAGLRGDREEDCRRHAAEALAAVGEAHPGEPIASAVGRQLDVLLEARRPGITLSVVAALEGAGRCPGTSYCLRAAQILADVARREAMACVAAGVGSDADTDDVSTSDTTWRALGEALFASTQAVLGSDDGTQGLHAVLAPALDAMLADALGSRFLDASERGLAEAMLRDEDWQRKALEAKQNGAAKPKKKTYYGRMKGAVRKAAGYSSTPSPGARPEPSTPGPASGSAIEGSSRDAPPSPPAAERIASGDDGNRSGDANPPPASLDLPARVSEPVDAPVVSLADVLGSAPSSAPRVATPPEDHGGVYDVDAGRDEGEAETPEGSRGVRRDDEDEPAASPSHAPPSPPLGSDRGVPSRGAEVPGLSAAMEEEDDEVRRAAAAAAAVVASGGKNPHKKKRGVLASLPKVGAPKMSMALPSAPRFASGGLFGRRKRGDDAGG